MRTYFILILVVFVEISPVFAQKIQVIAKSDIRPIENVFIHNQDSSKSVITNAEGVADISGFSSSETLYFSHIIYETKQVSKNLLVSDNHKVYLTEKLTYLDEIVFSADKSEAKKSELPMCLETMTAQQIRLDNPQTSADILAKSGAVFVQKSQAGGGSPVLRGFEANRVLLVIDGIRMNNAIYRSGHLQNVITIDPNIIERAEVTFGANSVIYGSDALGGVMHFYTRNPEVLHGDFELYGGGFVRYASANEEQSAGADLEYSKGKWAGLTHFTHSNFGDVRTGKNGNAEHIELWQQKYFQVFENQKDTARVNSNPLTQVGTAYQQWNWMQKVVYEPHDNNRYSLNFQYSTSSNIPRYERLTQYAGDELRYGEWYYSPQKRLLLSIRADFKDLSYFYDRASVILGVQDVEEGRITRRFGSNTRNVRTENVAIYSMNIDLTKKIKEKHHFSYGLESYYNQVSSTAYTENIFGGERGQLSTRYPDGGSEMQSFSFYVNHRQHIGNNPSMFQFIFSQGLRYNYVSLASIFENKDFFPLPFDEVVLNNNALSGSLGGILKFKDNLDMTMNISTGFRAPNVDDMGKIFDSEPGTVIVPNPNLRPEYTYNFEAGFRGKLFKKVQFNVSGFYTLLDNAIIRSQFLFNGQDSIVYDGVLSQVLANANAEQAVIHGWQADLSHPVGQFWEVRHQVTQTFGEITSRDEPLAHIPPLYGKSSVVWNYRKWNSEVFVQYNGKKSLETYSPLSVDRLDLATPDGMPAWMTWNYRLTYRFQTLTAQVAVENIFDRHYRVFASGLSAMGRNVVVSLRGNF